MAMIMCPSGHDNQSGARFCRMCGAPLAGSDAPPAGSSAVPPAPDATPTVDFSHPMPPPTDGVPPPTGDPAFGNPPTEVGPAGVPATGGGKSLLRNPLVWGGAAVVVIAAVLAVALLLSGSSGAQSTADAALGDLQAGNWAAFCTQVEPSVQSTCRQANLTAAHLHLFSHMHIVKVTTTGNSATAQVACTGTTSCSALGGNTGTFNLIKVSGRWYVVFDSSNGPFSGNSGNSGSSGSSGSSGNTGSSGSSGNTGNSGTSTTSGNTGTSGNSGTSTTSGGFGTSGNSGTAGSSGGLGSSGNS